MIEHLVSYKEINQVATSDAFIAAGECLVKDPNRSLLNYSKVGYILEGFQRLLQEKRTLEEFFLLGDKTSKQPLEEVPLVDEALFVIEGKLQEDPGSLEGSIVIVDQQAVDIYHNQTGSSLKVPQADLFVV